MDEAVSIQEHAAAQQVEYLKVVAQISDGAVEVESALDSGTWPDSDEWTTEVDVNAEG